MDEVDEVDEVDEMDSSMEARSSECPPPEAFLPSVEEPLSTSSIPSIPSISLLEQPEPPSR
jgi:hypothetical protein